MKPQIRTLELAAWDFDEYEFRPKTLGRESRGRGRELVAQRHAYQSLSALCEDETILRRDMLERQLSRCDLQAEMLGLDWFLAIVDLRQLLAFQRRLSFNPMLPTMLVPQPWDWDRLIDIAFASPHPVLCDVVHDARNNTVILQSANPNLHIRVTEDPSAPIAIHAGSPFFEVAHYANRWFLRDGYHRAYTLLRAGIFHLPAVVVHAKTLEELGAVKPRFFSESVLLADHPPFVTDFLNESLTIQYDRPSTIKTLRVTMEESVTAAVTREVSGEPS
jgi:hypothetical protein